MICFSSFLIYYILPEAFPPLIPPIDLNPCATLLSPQLHSSSFPLRKRQTSKKNQPNMAYQIIRLGALQIKVRLGNLVGGKESLKQTKESETDTAPIVRSSIKRIRVRVSNHSIYAVYLAQTHAGFVIVSSFSVSPSETQLVDSVVVLVMSLPLKCPAPIPFISPVSEIQLSHGHLLRELL